MIKIDIDTRCWQIPKEEAFLGVESDDKVKILRFELSKNEFCNGLNFTDCNCFINYKNEGNDTIPYGITDMEVQEDGTVTFTWEVSRGATIFKGNTFAILCAKKVSDDGTITNEWNSRIGSFTVAKGIEPLSSITEVPEIDIISQLLSVAQQTNANAQNNINQSSQLLEKAEGLGYLKEDFDVLEARMNQFTSLKEGSTTGDAELIDGRVGYDGKVHDNIGGAIREQVSELKGDLDDFATFPINYWTEGDISVSPSGTYAHKIVYCPVDISDMSGDKLKISIESVSDDIDTHRVYIGICDFEQAEISNKVAVNTFTNHTITTTGGHVTFNVDSIKESVKYIRIQAQAYQGNQPTVSDDIIYHNIIAMDASNNEIILKAKVDEDNLYTNLKRKLSLISGTGTKIADFGDMDSSFKQIEFNNHIKKNKRLVMSARVEKLTQNIVIGHGNGVYGGSKVEITPTKIIVYKYSTEWSIKKEVEHGLTIANDIFISIENRVSKYGFHAIIRIMSNGASYVNSGSYDFEWLGSNGFVFVNTGYNTILHDVKVGWNCDDFKAKIYAFGDSYFDYWNPKLADLGYADKFLLDGYGGRRTQSALTSFNNVVSLGQPRYILWCLGMNDDEQTVWENGFETVVETCSKMNITPIFCTIPNTPTKDNSAKNSYIKASGYRYVDIAKVVGADEVGSSWYDGLLSTDNIHPTEKGAYIIAEYIVTSLADIVFEC